MPSYTDEQKRRAVEAVRLVTGGMAGKGVAELPGVSSAAVVCNWAKAAKKAADLEVRMPIAPNSCDSSPLAYDGFDGALASWSIGEGPDAELANSSLRAACVTLAEGEGPVTHSDRGCHHRRPAQEIVRTPRPAQASTSENR